MTVLPPIAEADTVPTLPNTVLVFIPVTPTDAGVRDVHVSGMPVMVIPAVSVTVAFSVVVVPVLTRNDLLRFPMAAIEIAWTGQVVNCAGWLLSPLTDAKIGVEPGSFAETICWLRADPTGGSVSLTKFVSTACQLKRPTDAVTSVLPLKAKAS